MRSFLASSSRMLSIIIDFIFWPWRYHVHWDNKRFNISGHKEFGFKFIRMSPFSFWGYSMILSDSRIEFLYHGHRGSEGHSSHSMKNPKDIEYMHENGYQCMQCRAKVPKKMQRLIQGAHIL